MKVKNYFFSIHVHYIRTKMVLLQLYEALNYHSTVVLN